MGLTDLFERIPGQQRVAQELSAHLKDLKNAYFFIGPDSSGLLEGAKAFAKGILCSEQGCGRCDICVSIELGGHPDVTVFERKGNLLTVDEAREITRLAFRSTSGPKYQVMIVPEMELLERAAPVLLKTVEEPPLSTIFLLLAGQVTPDLVTLISRSVRVDFDSPSEERIYEHLVSMGYGQQESSSAVSLSGGSLALALRLVDDAELRSAFSFWREVPMLLERDMFLIVDLVDRLLGSVELSLAKRKAEQKEELAAMVELAKAQRVKTDLKDVEARNQRELRKLRTSHIRAGLLIIEKFYRDALLLASTSSYESESYFAAIDQIEDCQKALDRNSNEFLSLVALLTRLVQKGR